MADLTGHLDLATRGADREIGVTADTDRELDDPTDPMLWATPDGVSPDDQLVEQYGGGGDTDLATDVSTIDGTQWGYLRFTIQPTVPGGLTVIDCGN